jgi:hypothetical protein
VPQAIAVASLARLSRLYAAFYGLNLRAILRPKLNLNPRHTAFRIAHRRRVEIDVVQDFAGWPIGPSLDDAFSL